MNTNIIEDNIENDIKIKRTRNRLTKKEQFTAERQEIINKLNTILGIDDINNNVYLYDLENNVEIKQKIKDMVPNISKYHKCGYWGYFSKDLKKGMGNEIGLMRSVYKDNDYIITTKNKVIIRDEKKINSTVYYFNKVMNK